jgi:hypothetical protein
MHNFQQSFLAGLLVLVAAPLLSQQLNSDYARDPAQAIDQQYTDQIHKYTTDPSFLSPLVNYLPASKTVPTPAKVLGDVSGAPDMLPYAEDVYKYFRMLEAASPCVKVVSIGHTEEGREMIAVAIADPALLAGAKANDERPSSPIRAPSSSMTPLRGSLWISRIRCITSPGPFTRRKRERLRR